MASTGTSSGVGGPSSSTSQSAAAPNYLRQEIRGFMGNNCFTPTSASNTSSNNNGSMSIEGITSGNNEMPIASSSVTCNASQQISNRLSRLPSQMQQQHFKNLWKHYLYELQQKSPTPKRVICRYNISSRPAHYGREFHGIMTRSESDQLLLEEDGADGSYLVRESARTKADYIANLTRECRYEESPYMTLHRGRMPLVSSNSSHVPRPQQSSRPVSAIVAKTTPTPPTTVNSPDLSNKKGSNRRSMLDNMQIKPITSHEELAAPDEIYLAPGGAPLPTTTSNTGTINIQAFEKAHVFRTHTFIGNPWCDFCGNFIWGLIGQGVRCDDCGFGAHRKCSELVPNECCPDLRHIRRIFGVDLTTFVKASNCLRPFLVDLLVAEVERRGMTMEGIYRACGSADEVDALKNHFESHWEQADSYLRSVEDIHVITGLLKLYLRLLPIPLITFDVYPQFIEAL
ncbi:hypothetical protein RDWZM_002717, partial [Blomia tropicalis]